MTTAEQILQVARGELGYTESPAGSNRTKYGAWFGLNGQPWCMMFVQWVFSSEGAAALLPARTASCGAFMRSAQAAGRWVTGGYQPGDVVIYDFPGNNVKTDHCGIVEQLAGGGIMAIEGNTGTGNDADGGQVQRRIRSNKVILGAFRPDYDIEEKEDEDVVTYKYLKDVPEKFRPTIDQLMSAGIIQGDGSDPAGNGDVINLTHEQVRTLMFVYRGGGFDSKLRAAGLPPAVG
ncbi:MAG: CHAP domain-containing protein [Dysosmobacter sp.]|nr:CHAP domain-containing protein [Dysosmobacter sp.]